jgi:tetratricopeptide (TPR) repeat protein
MRDELQRAVRRAATPEKREMRHSMYSLPRSLGPLALTLCVLGTAPAWAADTVETPARSAANPNYVAGKAAVDSKNWKVAIDSLGKAAAQDASNADVQTLLAYAYRHNGQFKEAFDHYKEALRLNPRHRGAHEYIGEAYLLTNDLARAEEHLAVLNKLCVFSCEEYTDLKKSVEAYKRKP